jgi:hypothetical protein
MRFVYRFIFFLLKLILEKSLSLSFSHLHYLILDGKKRICSDYGMNGINGVETCFILVKIGLIQTRGEIDFLCWMKWIHLLSACIRKSHAE